MAKLTRIEKIAARVGRLDLSPIAGLPTRATCLPNLTMPWTRDYTLRERGIVYYFERFDRAVKIGCTRSYPQRRATLMRRNGAIALVAWEYGYYELEEERHRQFAHLRYEETSEWFACTEELIDHILMLRALL